MRVAVFSTKPFEKDYFAKNAQQNCLQLEFFTAPLEPNTAPLAKGFDAVSCFVNDNLQAETLEILVTLGVKAIALRCAGFNNVDLNAAKTYKMTVMRVPGYSPYAVAEFATALILALNRKIHKAYTHVREHNFLLNGLMGFDLHGKTVGIIGVGRIGKIFATIMNGFGCRVIASDPNINDNHSQNFELHPLKTVLQESDIISLHCPLTPGTHHLINDKTIKLLKPGMMLINTSRGGLIDSKAVINGLKNKIIGALGLDVYEEEEALFFKDLSDAVIPDDTFLRLQGFPNVLITGHQAFFTDEALTNIINTTLSNLQQFEKGTIENEVTAL
jgi:D-lactate dehydrogenase